MFEINLKPDVVPDLQAQNSLKPIWISHRILQSLCKEIWDMDIEAILNILIFDNSNRHGYCSNYYSLCFQKHYMYYWTSKLI